MIIVHFDQMFHPEFGDQINILPKFQVKQGHEVFIITGKSDVPHPRFKYFADNSNMDLKDSVYEKNTGVKIIRIGVKRFISGRAIFEKGYKELIDNLNPDILFCHFNDTLVGMHYTLLSKKMNYPVVFDSHMLDIASKNKFKKVFRNIYRMFFTPIIKRHELIVIRTQDDPYVNQELGIPKELTPFLSFGSDTSLFYPSDIKKEKNRREMNIDSDDFVIIYAGQLNKDKGIDILLESFEKKIDGNVTLILIGNSRIEDIKLIEEKIRLSQNKILKLPTQKYVDLAKYYQAADLCVFPKQCSLSFYDAQACGLPVVAEDNNINKSRLSFGNGVTYKFGDATDLRIKLEKFINMSYEEIELYKKNARELILDNYNYENISKEYEEILKRERELFNEKRRS